MATEIAPFIVGTPEVPTFEELKRRRAIAAALAARQRKAPTNIGEGLTELGHGIGEMIGNMRLREMERQQLARDRRAQEPPSFDAPVTPDQPPAPAPVVPPVQRTPPAPQSGVFPDPPTLPQQVAALQPQRPTPQPQAPLPPPQARVPLPPVRPPQQAVARPPEPPPEVVPEPPPPSATVAERFAPAFAPASGPVEPPEPPLPSPNAAVADRFPPDTSPNQQVAERFAPLSQRPPMTRAVTNQQLMFDPTMAQGGIQTDTSQLPAADLSAPSQTMIAMLSRPLSPAQPPPEQVAQRPVDPRAPVPGPMAMPRPRPPQDPSMPPPQMAGAPPPPPAPSPRDAATAILVQRQQQQRPQVPSERELMSDALLAEVIGGNAGERGPQTAARGDVASDAPDPGVGALTGKGISDSIRARRHNIYNAVQQQQNAPTAPAVPPPDPTQAGVTPPSIPTTSPSISTDPAGGPDPVRLAQASPGIRPDSVWPTVPPPRDTSQGIPPAPEPGRYPSAGPEPQPPGPSRAMEHYGSRAADRTLSDDVRLEMRRRYDEEKAKVDAAFVRKWELWKADMVKEREYNLADPIRRQSMEHSHLANVKARRDLEGEGFLPLTPEEMASLPTPPAGQIIYKNRRGELKFGPTPPASTTVNIDQKATGKGLEKLEEKMAEHFVETFTAGNTAADDLQNISTLRQTALRVGTGPGAVAKGFLGRVGIKTEGISDIEAFDATINRLTPQQRVPGSGATSDFDARMFRGSLPALMNTPGGNALILDVMEGLAKNKMDRAAIAGRVVSRQITIADGTQEMLKLQGEARAMSDRVKAHLEANGVKAPRNEEDAAAAEWLKSNPNDPRAPEIKRRLGM